MIIESSVVPFALALGFLVALLIIEVLGLLLGWSLIAESDAGDAADLSVEAFDIDPDLPDLEAQIETAFDAMEAGAGETSGHPTLLDITEKQKAPFIIRLAAFCLVFGLVGLGLQTGVQTVLGRALHPALASLLVAPLGWLGAGRISDVVTRLLPQTETTATRAQFMGGLRGVVTQGTARRGAPAEVRLRDRHGNTHYLRCEPLRRDAVIPEGTEVLTVRRRIPPEARLRGDGADDWALAILPLTE